MYNFTSVNVWGSNDTANFQLLYYVMPQMKAGLTVHDLKWRVIWGNKVV